MTTDRDHASPRASINAMIIVCIVDDDASVRKSLSNLLRSAGYRSRVFTSGKQFLAIENFDDIACLLLDLKMHGRSEVEVMHALTLKDRKSPVIWMSAHWDEATLAEISRYEHSECSEMGRIATRTWLIHPCEANPTYTMDSSNSERLISIRMLSASTFID